MSNNKKHFLWGRNDHNECIVSNMYHILRPYLMNDIISQETKGKIIKNIYLGYYTTQIFVE